MSDKHEMEIEDDEPQVEQEQPKVEDEGFAAASAKYRAAATVVNEVITKLITECKPGKKVVDLCEFGDQLINKRTQALLKTEKGPRGIAFPTCVNVNNIVAHYSPLDTDTLVLKAGDIVRIDAGAHFDGYIAVGATTFALSDQPITGRAADALAAADKAMEASLRLMKPGGKNADVTQAIAKVASEFGVNSCEGVLSHQLKRYVLDGRNVIIGKSTPEQQVDDFVFQDDEVYSLDIVMSTGPGKLKEIENKCIYKRNPENTYQLKRKSSRVTLNEINKFNNMAFSVRSLDKKTGRMGIIELFRSGLVDPYPVLGEKPGEFVAQLKTTVFITASSVTKAVNAPLPKFTTTKAIQDPEILNLLQTSLKSKKKAKQAATTTASATTTTSTTGGDSMEVE